MKIGILTFHRVINYGALLQAYALNKKIRDIGFECEDIDYTAKKIKDFYNPFKISKFSDFKDLALYLLNYNSYKRTHKAFHSFLNNYIPISSICCDDCLEIMKGKYDLLICGSDQIWNNDITGNDSAYLLDFDSHVRKISYAGSFGKEYLPKDFEAKCRENLIKFSDVTVREFSAKAIIDRLIGNRTVEVVLDPVFLLKKEEWLTISAKPLVEKPYVFIFMLHYNEETLEYAKRIARERRLSLLTISDNNKYGEDIKHIGGCGPMEFISAILNSELIVTDSFHVCSMSIILNKQFIVGLKKGKLKNLNTRIYTLLNTFGLVDRILPVDSHRKPIDYNNIVNILNEKRESAIMKLNNMILKK